MDVKAHLKTLVATPGVSAHEEALREVVRAAWTPLVSRFDGDKLGTLIGVKEATRPPKTRRKIMLAAHMDEIGMIVREVRDGFVLVWRVGGMDNRVMLSQPVVIHGRKAVPALVASVPPHLTAAEARHKYVAWEEIVLDPGLTAAELEEWVAPGDLVTQDAPLIELLGDKVAGKALDDRACLAAVTACLDHLNGMHHVWDVYAAATVQEEVGLRGATTAAYHIAPDLAIALDVCFADQAGISADDAKEMGGGPGIGLGPNFHPKWLAHIKKIAEQYDIPLQDDLMPGASGTDAWAIQVSQTGIPTALLEVAICNMHSPVETCSMTDIERTGRLLAQVIASLDADFLDTLNLD